MASESSEDFSLDNVTNDFKTEISTPQGSVVKNMDDTSPANASKQEQDSDLDTKKDDDDSSTAESWKTAELIEDTTESEEASENDKCKKEEEKDSTKVDKHQKSPKHETSLRLERLARPKKDILDKISHIRPYGSLPESALPAWCDIPLQTKVPAGNCPFKMTKAQLATNLFLPPARFDLFDEHNMRLPSKTYNSLEDPQLKTYLSQKRVRKHLYKNGFLSKTGRIICSLDDLNNYREFHRHMLAQQVQQYLREQDAEEKKEAQKKRKEQLDRQDKIHIAKKSQGLFRKWIKDTAAFYEHRSLGRQTVREQRILNRQLRIQREVKEKILAKQERYENIYNQHITTKYQTESMKRKLELEMAKKDLEVLEKLCRRKEGEKLEIKKKVLDFWERKSASQYDWLLKGKEAEEMREKEKEYNLKIFRETGKLPESMRKCGRRSDVVKKGKNFDVCKRGNACISSCVSGRNEMDNEDVHGRKEEKQAAVNKIEIKNSEDQNSKETSVPQKTEEKQIPNLQSHTLRDKEEASADLMKGQEKKPETDAKLISVDTKKRNNLNVHENENSTSTGVSSVSEQNNETVNNRKEETKAVANKAETKTLENQNFMKIKNSASEDIEQKRIPNLQPDIIKDKKEPSASAIKDKETNEKEFENDAKNVKPSKTDRSESNVGTVVTVHRNSFLINSGAMEVDVEVIKDTMTGEKEVLIDTKDVEGFEVDSTSTEQNQTASQNENISTAQHEDKR